MRQITALTADSKQRYILVGEGNLRITIILYYMPRSQGWYMNLDDGSFSVNGIRVGVSYNILYKFKNLINYGIAITSTDGLDPFYINDFTSGRIRFLLLDKNDKELVEQVIYEVRA
jgi:hypothetical protein